MKHSLSVIEQGQGVAVILLHGFCERKEVWEGIIEPLSAEAKVLAPDLPGFGQSQLNATSITIEDAALAVIECMNSRNIEQAIVVGHSLGGYVSLAMAEKYPSRLAALCLFHSTAKSDSEEKKDNRTRTVGFLEKYGTRTFADNFVPSIFADNHHESMYEQIEKAKKMVAQTSDQTAIAYTRAMRDRPARLDVLKGASFPCLFIAGKNDSAVPYQDMLEQSQLPQDSRLCTLDNSGHMGMYEEPEKSTRALLDFISYIKSKN